MTPNFMERCHAGHQVGNRLAVRIPTTIVSALELSEGDETEITIDAPRTFARRKAPDTEALFERLHTLRGKIPADFKFSRDDANARH